MKARTLLLAIPLALLAMNAFANGNHAGGHHADDEAIGTAKARARGQSDSRTVEVRIVHGKYS